MKKALLILIILIVTITSCERDDICIDDITPNLIIRFYDTDTPDSFKSVNQLKVKIVEIENDSLTFSTDSIVIPVKVTNNTTQYILTINSNDDANHNTDTITVSYNLQDIFVGRSCGFKNVFNDVTYQLTTDNDNWIKNIVKVTDTIKNETAAHVKIFH